MDDAHKKLLDLTRRGLAATKMVAISGLDLEARLENALVQAEHILSFGFHLHSTLTRDNVLWRRTWNAASGEVVTSVQGKRLTEARRNAAIAALEAKTNTTATGKKDAVDKPKTA